GIPVSPGYGRMGNSLLAYALGIAKPDPYRYGLIIERSPHIFYGTFGINVSADRCGELISFVKRTWDVNDSCRTLDLVELSALDLMQGVLDRISPETDAGRFWEAIPPDDADTFGLLGRGDTDGVYQLDSETAKGRLRDWRPASLDDLFLFIATSCFGAEELFSLALARRNGDSPGPRVEPLLESVTGATLGIAVYQEQVIRVAMEAAGYGGEDGDLLRRILSKKRPGELERERVKFIGGCLAKSGMPEARACALFDQLERFASYSVIKAHVVAHGLLTYRMAYLKAHYPLEFEAQRKKGLRP
ncbi:MAG: hypothetical protein WCK89_26295, partial [bacterium]